MCYWLLTESGNVIARTSVQHVTREDYFNEDLKRQIEEFDAAVDERLHEEGFYTEDAQTATFFLQDEDDTELGDDDNTP